MIMKKRKNKELKKKIKRKKGIKKTRRDYFWCVGEGYF